MVLRVEQLEDKPITSLLDCYEWNLWVDCECLRNSNMSWYRMCHIPQQKRTEDSRGID